jgi:hypothetical protein
MMACRNPDDEDVISFLVFIGVLCLERKVCCICWSMEVKYTI